MSGRTGVLRTVLVVAGHVITDDVDPAHGTVIFVIEDVAVKDAALTEVGRLEADLAFLILVAGDGIVELALLVLLTAAAGLDDQDVVQMEMEGMGLGSG